MESLFREFLLEINVKIEVKYFLKKISILLKEETDFIEPQLL